MLLRSGPPCVLVDTDRRLMVEETPMFTGSAAAIESSLGALARPGGGQSFSSGGGRGGGTPLGSGGTVGFSVPASGQPGRWFPADLPSYDVVSERIGIWMMLVGAFLLFRLWRNVTSWKWTPRRKPKAARRAEPPPWKAIMVAPVAQIVHRASDAPRSRLDANRSIDPNFSVALFEDFVYLLYAEMQRSRAGDAASLSLAPFLSNHVAQGLLSEPRMAGVHGIVIGAARTTYFSGVKSLAELEIELEFEASYVEVHDSADPSVPRSESRFYVVDRMRLRRARTAKSRPAERARKLDCPNCGGPLQNMRGTRCSYCSQDVGGGRFDWNVFAFRTLTKRARGPLLTEDVHEAGADEYPTLVDPDADARLQDLQQRDPLFQWDTFRARVTHVFQQLQVGWSKRDPARIRPYVSDNLFQSWVYWMDLYRRERRKNINKNAKILRIDLANVVSDRAYDAITVRIFVSAVDYTISDDGRVLSGSPDRARAYSEYFTLLRGVARNGDSNCPHCGAPLAISMVGNCQHCDTKILSGEFDWVLSRIEQAESYAG